MGVFLGLACAGSACGGGMNSSSPDPSVMSGGGTVGAGQGGDGGTGGRGGDPRGDLEQGPVSLVTSEGPLEVVVLEERFVQLRLKRSSEATSLASFAVDPAYVPGLPPYQLKEAKGKVTITTKEMELRIESDPLVITQIDRDGVVALQQTGANLWENGGPRLRFSLDEGERVYGLGDKAKGHDRRGHQFEMWNKDAFGWEVDQDPLYKSFPVFVLMDEGKAHGVFVDSPIRAHVDVGATVSSELSYSLAQGDAVDVYLFAGPEPKTVIESYTQLTGRTPLPPYWSLGFHMSRYGYLSEQQVRDVVSRFDAGDIPLDVVWLDIDFQQDNAPFTVNQTAFPGFSSMISDFSAQGVKTVCITDLHIKSYQDETLPSGYAPYDSGAAGDHFVRAADNEGFFVGEVWPGDAVFPEFTLTRTRKWWGALYADFLDQGVAGFWNDMNEPAVFQVTSMTMPEDLKHRLDDGRVIDHQVVHNAFGALNVRATFEGVSRLRPNERPFTLTRAAYSGAQRYSASWTGDNTADRAHLAATIPNLTNLGVSGYPFIGADVGGFDGCPDEQLLVEWMELGAFQPFYRNHSGKGTCMREPWVHGAAVEARTKKAIERRYRYLPYIYTLFEEAARTGIPMMRPLWLQHPDDATVADNDRLFFVGDDLLVAPQLKAGAGAYQVQLPRADFFDVMTGAFHERGGALSVEAPPEDSLRLYGRAGGIIPLAPVVEHSSIAPTGPLTLLVFPGNDCHGSLYLDDGKSLAYRAGAARRWDISCTQTAGGIEVQVVSQGDFPVWWSEVALVIYGEEPRPGGYQDGASTALPVIYDAQMKTATVTVANDGSSFAVSGR